MDAIRGKDNKGNGKFFGLVFLFLLILFSLTGCEGTPAQAVEGELKVHFLDVGQADSILLENKGQVMLIDAGNRDDSETIIKYLKEQGIQKITAMVLTHPHEDHIGSAEKIIKNFEISEIIYQAETEYESVLYDNLRETIKKENCKVMDPKPGTDFSFGDCKVEVLAPDKEYEDVNNRSVVIKVTYGSNSFLFTGDGEKESEKAMIEAGYDLESDVLKAGHHGSDTSSSYLFLRAVNPKYTVISCGKDNKYGHPHKETISRLQDLGTTIYRTDTMGTIVLASDGTTITWNQTGDKSEKEHNQTDNGLVNEGEEMIISPYIGNKKSMKFHLAECASLPDKENRVFFDTREEAIEENYSPCGRCKP